MPLTFAQLFVARYIDVRWRLELSEKAKLKQQNGQSPTQASSKNGNTLKLGLLLYESNYCLIKALNNAITL